MPQLDKFSFFTQIFWLIVLLAIFYYLLVNHFLPNLSSVLKLRYKVLSKLKHDLVSQNQLQLNIYKFRKENILNLILVMLNSVTHFNLMISKYNEKIETKIKNRIKLRPKLDKRELRKLYAILQTIFPTRKFS